VHLVPLARTPAILVFLLFFVLDLRLAQRTHRRMPPPLPPPLPTPQFGAPGVGRTQTTAPAAGALVVDGAISAAGTGASPRASGSTPRAGTPGHRVRRCNNIFHIQIKVVNIALAKKVSMEGRVIFSCIQGRQYRTTGHMGQRLLRKLRWRRGAAVRERASNKI
jgi:hypothetical protein